jgi:hypothetical protein
LQNIEDVAFADINKERNTRWISHEGRSALTILQFGLQYYQFAQSAMRSQIEKLHDYTCQQISERDRLQQILEEKKSKNKYLR